MLAFYTTRYLLFFITFILCQLLVITEVFSQVAAPFQALKHAEKQVQKMQEKSAEVANMAENVNSDTEVKELPVTSRKKMGDKPETGLSTGEKKPLTPSDKEKEKENAPDVPNTNEAPKVDGDIPADPERVKQGDPIIEENLENAVDAPEQLLWEREPFNRIRVKSQNKLKYRDFDVLPLTFPGGKRPSLEKGSYKAGTTLPLKLVADPENEREVLLSNVLKIELFDELLTAEVRRLSKEGKFDEAFRGILFIRDTYPKTPDLHGAYIYFLMCEAIMFADKGNYDMALVRIQTLAKLKERGDNFSELYTRVATMLAREKLSKKEYATLSQVIRDFLRVFPENPQAKKMNASLINMAQKRIKNANKALETRNVNTAVMEIREAKELYPDLPAVTELEETLRLKYPYLTVAVTWPATQFGQACIYDWASLRSRRLLYRPLVEFQGPGAAGGVYQCPFGLLTTENLNRSLRLKLRDGIGWAGTKATLSAYDVSRLVLTLKDPNHINYNVLWDEIFNSVEVMNDRELLLHFNRAHVLPRALLQVLVLPYTSPEAMRNTDAGNGPFILIHQNGEEVVVRNGRVIPLKEITGNESLEKTMKIGNTGSDKTSTKESLKKDDSSKNNDIEFITRFEMNQNYFMDAETDTDRQGPRPILIEERYYSKGRNAILALKRGEVDALDRVNPWDVEDLKKEKDITVSTYSTPFVHTLLPNRNRPLLSNKIFRRALVYGINRVGILTHLMGGHPPTGARVVSGPFSAGSSVADPLAYAYDTQIAPRPYNPHLAAMLARIAVAQVKDAKKKEKPGATNSGKPSESPEKQDPSKEKKKKTDSPPENEASSPEDDPEKEKIGADRLPIEPLVLAYPPHEVARVSCSLIAKQLELIGIPVKLYEFAPGECVQMRPEIDLLYAELCVAEPLLDARAILGSSGPTHRCSTYVDLALRQLDRANDWKQIGVILRRLHHLAHDDAAVIPLWQFLNHYAYRSSMKGIEPLPFTLYEKIEDWKTTEKRDITK